MSLLLPLVLLINLLLLLEDGPQMRAARVLSAKYKEA